MPTRFSILFIVLSLGLVACGGDEPSEETDCPDDGKKSAAGEQFASHYAVAYCDLRKDCYPDAFEDEFGTTETCQKAVSKREIQQDCDGCDLDEAEGDNCLEAAESISCLDWVDDGALEAACDARWDCSDA